MRIIAAAGEFDLPLNFETQITKYNVMLTSVGDQSNPITLPSTANNLKLVGYSNRLDAAYKPISDIAITFINEINVRPANLGVHTADEVDGISCTLYIGTGDFYSKVGNTRLTWLAWPTVKSPNYVNESDEERVDYLISLLKNQFTNPIADANFKVEPVATSLEVEWYDEGVSRKRPLVLNGFEDYYWSLPASGTVDINIFHGEYVHQSLESSDVISYGKGYGMTPFLKLEYVLRFIFEKFGYTFDGSEINVLSERILKDTVILNNVADAIYTGVLKYKQLLPDMLITEFLKETEKLLSGKFIVSEISNVIKFKFYKHLFQSNALIDLSTYLSSRIKMSATEFKIIKITEADKLTTSDEADDKVERYEFDLLKEKEIEILFRDNFEEADGSVFFKMVKTENIIYLNSTFVVNGETKESKDTAATTLQLFTASDVWSQKTIEDVDHLQLIVNYKESNEYLSVPFPIPGDSIGKLKWIYDEYVNYFKNSNITVEAKLQIPDYIFEKIDQHSPVLLNGQILLIEYLKKSTSNENSSGIIEARFRTMRDYVDR